MKKEYILITLAILLLASGHPIGNMILRQIDALQLAALSSLLSSITLLAALSATGAIKKIHSLSRRDLPMLAIAGLFQFTLYPIMTFSALARIPPAINAFLIGTSPILITIMSAFISRERLSSLGYAGIAVGFIGVGVVLFGGDLAPMQLSSLATLGPLFSLVAALLSASYTILGRRIMARHDALPTTALANVIGAAVLFPVVMGTVGFGALSTSSLTTKLLVLYWGIFSGVGAYLYYFGLKRLEAPKTASFIYLSPVFAALLSFFIVGEPITAQLVAGLVIISIALWSVQHSK
ncbi:MAG: DMT family transporter [Thaumarchaeota archaeon]|nr:DMT family transporter [Nitrososphaerota archaeon]